MTKHRTWDSSPSAQQRCLNADSTCGLIDRIDVDTHPMRKKYCGYCDLLGKRIADRCGAGLTPLSVDELEFHQGRRPDCAAKNVDAFLGMNAEPVSGAPIGSSYGCQRFSRASTTIRVAGSPSSARHFRGAAVLWFEIGTIGVSRGSRFPHVPDRCHEPRMVGMGWWNSKRPNSSSCLYARANVRWYPSG